jgi:hypothetical protein
VQITNVNISNLRGIARLINHAAFKKLATDTNQSSYIRQLKKYSLWQNNPEENLTLHDLISHSYEVLVKNYRHEYIYKSKLLNDFILKNYSLDDTIILDEFRVNDSIADIALINGTNKIFEIKTELDSLERFESQISDYYKAFSEVYIVIHYSFFLKYVKQIDDKIGIILYTEDSDLVEYRKAESEDKYLHVPSMMASLRKPEYLKLVKQLVGFIPNATPVFLYSECLKVLLEFTPKEVQIACHKILKQRISFGKNTHIIEGTFPNYLNYSYYNQNISKKSYLTLLNNLNKKI